MLAFCFLISAISPESLGRDLITSLFFSYTAASWLYLLIAGFFAAKISSLETSFTTGVYFVFPSFSSIFCLIIDDLGTLMEFTLPSASLTTTCQILPLGSSEAEIKVYSWPVAVSKTTCPAGRASTVVRLVGLLSSSTSASSATTSSSTGLGGTT